MDLVKGLLVTFVFGLSWLSFSSLPDLIPMHWNWKGEIDSYWPKQTGVWFVPGITLLMWIGFKIFPYFDPKKEKYNLFKSEWEIIQIGIIGFMAFVHFVTLSAARNPEMRVDTWIVIGIGGLLILVGNYLSKIRQNYFIGIKTPWSLASEDNWNKTHRFGSWCFVIGGIAVMAGAALGLMMPILMMVAIIGASFIPMLYSFLVFKKKESLIKYFLGVMVGIVMILGVIRVFAGEDDWICIDGRWVAHGNPSVEMPSKSCEK